MFKYKFTIISFCLVLALLLIPVRDIPVSAIATRLTFADKIVHFGIFSFLFFVYAFEYYQNNKKSIRFLKTILFFSAFALLTEVFQFFSGYRSFDLIDAVVDIFAVSCAYLVSNAIINWRISKKLN